MWVSFLLNSNCIWLTKSSLSGPLAVSEGATTPMARRSCTYKKWNALDNQLFYFSAETMAFMAIVVPWHDTRTSCLCWAPKSNVGRDQGASTTDIQEGLGRLRFWYLCLYIILIFKKNVLLKIRIFQPSLLCHVMSSFFWRITITNQLTNHHAKRWRPSIDQGFLLSPSLSATTKWEQTNGMTKLHGVLDPCCPLWMGERESHDRRRRSWPVVVDRLAERIGNLKNIVG